MLKSYCLIAWRTLRRYSAYSFFNIVGLTLGIASCIILFFVVRYELSYDAFNSKASRTYRVTLHALDYNPSISLAVAPALRNDFAQLEQVAQVMFNPVSTVKKGTTLYDERNVAYAEPQLTQVFDYSWLAGDAKTALATPNSVVLTQTIARKYFGEENPVGRLLTIDNNDLKVTGVIKDIPGNSHLPVNLLVSLSTIQQGLKDLYKYFYAIPGGSFAYIVTPPGYRVEQLQQQMKPFIAKNWGKDIAHDADILLQPLTDIHFDQRYLHSTISPTTSRESYMALAAIAVLIILIACINFINLATAQAARRAKEVGIRKVLGSTRTQLVVQFLGETTCIVVVSVVLAWLACLLFLPVVTGWLGIHLSIAVLYQPAFISALLGLTIVLVLLAGLYPAFVQSAFTPAASLKTQTGNTVSFFGINLRKSLVVVQFCISQVLIAGTLIVSAQMNFFRNQDLGFNKEAVVSFNLPDVKENDALKQALQQSPGVQQFTLSSGTPVSGNNATSFSSAELGIVKDDVTEIKFVDEHYTSMFGIQQLAGRPLVPVNANDTLYNITVNETMVHKLGFQNLQQALGKHLLLNGSIHATITGVVKDFQSESKHKLRRPVVLLYAENNFFNASVHIETKNMPQTLARLEKVYNTLYPGNLFRYEFVDDHIAAWYQQEQQEYTAFKLFSVIAIVIGCLGLYGLVSFTAMQRTKEIGVRKILGATSATIALMFSKELLALIAIAFCVAAPLAWWIMHNWLNNFAYQVNIGVAVFALAIGSSIAIAAITIAWQVGKAAFANPVKNLRSE